MTDAAGEKREPYKNEAGNTVVPFTFTVPKESPTESGVKKDGEFTYHPVTTDQEAAGVIKEQSTAKTANGSPAKGAEGWGLKALVNSKLFDNARAAAYQKALTPFRPITKTPEQMQEDSVIALMRIGIPEDKARETVLGLTAAQTENVAGSA